MTHGSGGKRPGCVVLQRRVQTVAPRVPGRLEAVSQQAESVQETGPGLQEISIRTGPWCWHLVSRALGVRLGPGDGPWSHSASASVVLDIPVGSLARREARCPLSLEPSTQVGRAAALLPHLGPCWLLSLQSQDGECTGAWPGSAWCCPWPRQGTHLRTLMRGSLQSLPSLGATCAGV